MKEFELYFSKTNYSPAIKTDEKILLAKHVEIKVPVKGKWKEFEESPSWVISGKANEIHYDEKKDIISIR